MCKFIARLNDDSYINITADQMIYKLDSNMVAVYNSGSLVALLDLSVVLTAHLSEKAEGKT